MNALRDVHLELSSKCTAACPKCPRTILKGSYAETDLSMDFIMQVLDARPRHVHLLGNLGDPIYHDRFPAIIRLLGDRRQAFTVYTIGSGFGADWWRAVYGGYATGGRWVFSVDGASSSAGIYRKGLNWAQSWDAMRIGRELNKDINWQYIVFSHNQDHIDEARKLAAMHGINLRIDFNEKWDSESDPWMPTKSKLELGL